MTSCISTMNVIAQDKKSFTLEDLMPGGNNYFNLQPKNLHGLKWWGDVCVNADIEEVKAVNPTNGKETVLFTLQDTNDLLAAKELGKMNHLYNVSFPYAEKWMLVNTSTHKVLIDCDKKEIIWSQPIAAKAANQDWNKNSRSLAYTIANNLFVTTADGKTHQVTDEPKGIVCGQSVHRQEFGIYKGTFWSPKGNLLAFYRMDETMVTDYPQVNTTTRIATLEPDKYPMAGMTSHKVTVGVYNPATEKTVYLKAGDPTDRYFTNISWSPDEKSVYVIELNRDQNHAELVRYNAENGEKDAYTFSGTNITMGGVTVKYNGIITPKAMKLSLDVTMAHANNLAHTYAFPAYSHTTNEEATIRNSGASYVNITTKEGAESIAPIVLQMQQMATNILDVLFPYVLKNITLEKDGIVTANYTTSPIDMKEIMEVANAGKTDAEFRGLIGQRTYVSSPKGLAYWNQTGDKAFVVQLNIPAIISLIAENNGQQIDPQLIAGISEALLKSDPARLKLALSTLNMILNNEIITYILKMDDNTFVTLLSWMRNGIPMGISQATKDHTYIYLKKETLTPFINIIDILLKTNLDEVVALFDKMEIGVDLTIQK